MQSKTLVKGLSLLITAVATAYAQQRQQPRPTPSPLKVMPLKGGVYWTSGGAGGNTGFVIGPNGVIVIDAKMTADSAHALLAEIAKLTPKPVTHVILTHSDGDHVNGLAGFPNGLTIIAHENCKKEMTQALEFAPPAMAALRDYLPTQTIADTQGLTLDGVRLRLLHLAPGHTSGDLMVYFPDQKIVFAGDILTLQFPYPLIHREKHGNSQGWITNMNGMLAVDADTFVPGHGDLQTRAALEKKLADTQARRGQVAKLFGEGKTLRQTREALREAEPQTDRGRQGFPSFTEVVYREISTAQPFDAHNLDGFWRAHGASIQTNQRHDISLNAPPMTAWAQAKYDANKPGLNGTGPGRAQPLGNDPIMICDPVGYPRVLAASGDYGLQIIQAQKEMLIFFDWFYARRDIWTDGRKLPADPEPRFYGNSVGRWEADTFVVESNGFDQRTWLDSAGHPHSDEMTIVERYRRVDHDTIELNFTLNDAKAYTQPWVSETKYLELFPADELEARGSGWNDLREDVCVPSEEAKYRDQVRVPAATPQATASPQQ